MINPFELYRKFFQKRHLKAISPYVNLDSDSYYGMNFYVDLRKVAKKQFLKIGKNCIVDGKFVFETDEGFITIGDRCHIGAVRLFRVLLL